MPKPLLCVTVTGSTMAELRQNRDAVSHGDLVELRLDTVRDPDVAGALAGRKSAAIVTCRPKWEGGHFAGSEEERKKILAEALRLGAEYVDVEWRAGFDDLICECAGRNIVLSSHDFDGVPRDLADRLRTMRSKGAAVVKIAAKANALSDCVPLIELSRRAARDGGVVIIGMGEHGAATRILAGRFGSAWTYAGGLGEIGQLTPGSLLNEFRFLDITDSTAIYGVVAGTTAHSASPAMHNAAFRETRLDAVYLPMPSVSADDFITFARAFGVKGASVTIPHKIALFDRVDEVHPVARRVGAINTIRMGDDGRWIGANTDVSGFLQPLKDRVAAGRLRASLLGAGGAARAVAVALASSGCTVTIHARDSNRARETAMQTSSDVGPWPPAAGTWDLLVNCTPVGMHPRVDETPVPAGLLSGRFVYDLVYNPPVTRLLRDAARVGCETIGGLEMLVGQAVDQFEWWTGSRAPASVMREAAVKRLAEFARDENYFV